MNYKFSVVIPIYNRPDELKELLNTLVDQTRQPDEIIIIEDGSTIKSTTIVEDFKPFLPIQYSFQENAGQGFARNAGYRKASGDYLFVFDSDCLLPKKYFEIVESFLRTNPVDAFGGPDASHPSFTVTQKAISHTMTSFFTTGGMRGGKKRIGTYHPRSFNMAISKKVFEETQGYKIPFMGEDLEFSTRIIAQGFSTALIQNAFVYHKRRTSLKQFFRQLFYFGRARINLTRFHPKELKLMHFFPLVFSSGLLFSVLLAFIYPLLSGVMLLGYLAYFLGISLEGTIKYKSLPVGLRSIPTTILQMLGYGSGLAYELLRKWRGIDPNTKYIELYK